MSSAATRVPVRALPWRLEPLSLPGRSRPALAGTAAVVMIAAISSAEFADPGLTSLGSLILLPVVVAAWLLDAPLCFTVAAIALGSRALASVAGGLDQGTAVAEGAAICIIAGTTRLAALARVRARAIEKKAAEQEIRLARLDERDRIAAEIAASAVKELFAVTLKIEAAMQEPSAAATTRLAEAVTRLDQVSAELRRAVYKSGP